LSYSIYLFFLAPAFTLAESSQLEAATRILLRGGRWKEQFHHGSSTPHHSSWSVSSLVVVTPVADAVRGSRTYCDTTVTAKFVSAADVIRSRAREPRVGSSPPGHRVSRQMRSHFPFILIPLMIHSTVLYGLSQFVNSHYLSFVTAYRRFVKEPVGSPKRDSTIVPHVSRATVIHSFCCPFSCSKPRFERVVT
jgi:hypothetical protein